MDDIANENQNDSAMYNEDDAVVAEEKESTNNTQKQQDDDDASNINIVNNVNKTESETLETISNAQDAPATNSLNNVGLDNTGKFSYASQEERHSVWDRPCFPLPTGTQVQCEVLTIEGPTRFVSVAVVNECPMRKPFLGGFRNKMTQQEYHHALIQTNPLPRKKAHGNDGAPVKRFHRDTQTARFKPSFTQTYREQGTQMEKPGLYIDNSNDRVVISEGEYFDSEALAILKLEKAVFIQSYYRGYQARKMANKLREEKQQMEAKQQKEEEQRRQEMIQKKHHELTRRMHPRTEADFNILYSELEHWRKNENLKIQNTTLGNEQRKQALAELLRKETKLLQTIDRLKNQAAKENYYDKVTSKLEKIAKPKAMPNVDGTVTQIETPFTVRAKELMDLYQGLNTDMLSVDERLDVLLHVKWTVKEFDCQLTRDIVELIDREADLLNRGRKDKSLEGLRKRIASMFLQFIETPEFNPEAISLLKVPIEYAIRTHIKPLSNK